MIYNYGDCIKKYESKYNLDKAIANGRIYKIEKGIYSDKKNVSEKIRLILCKAVTDISIEEVDEKLIASVLK